VSVAGDHRQFTSRTPTSTDVRSRQPRIASNFRHSHLGSAILRRLQATEGVTRQSANTAKVAQLERSSTPRSTTTTSSGWRRTSRHAPLHARRRRSTRPLGVVAEEQTPTALQSPRKLSPSKSVKWLRRYGDLTVFKMAAVRHLRFGKFKFFNGLGG